MGDAKSEEAPFKKPIAFEKLQKKDNPSIEATESHFKQVKSFPYEEPSNSALPQSSEDYILEVLKNGAIIETINLMKRSFWMFGRLTNCHICMQHPTISRHHAVLQYRQDADDAAKTGFYIYDLESTHGTFLNKNRIRSRSYMRIQVGHMLKLGCSTRSYILNGPLEDAEEESNLSVTELYQKKRDQQEAARLKETERLKKEEERGVDWGLGEDAEEETDLSENPYAQTNNEDLYLDNPKKALRGFFEREDLELEYDCTEQGIGQFLCKVELPIDDEMGRPIYAEVIHKGKKKEVVIQCALEACRILDRHGVLRQATHESKKRKPKNWEENDYYDSDEDTFLDRTGTIEKKREKRMNAKIAQKAETYESLSIKEKELNEKITKLQLELNETERKLSDVDLDKMKDEVDSLDSFMKELNEKKVSKQEVNKMKSEILKLKQQHAEVIRLVNITKPAMLPSLVADYKLDPTSNKNLPKNILPIFGKRKKIKVELASSSKIDNEIMEDNSVEENEEIRESIKLSSEENDVGKEIELSEKKRRKNQRRIQQRQEKAQMERKKGYEEDASKEDYNMWVPPSGQTGDGRTALNDKLGY